ncbi:hypothetical protein EDC04DRAFT_2625449 [Pisolithus marmoratus]|nr:hypothetical protein EDC04DRAFT_2625449 [Pisolithus marmoratus]
MIPFLLWFFHHRPGVRRLHYCWAILPAKAKASPLGAQTCGYWVASSHLRPYYHEPQRHSFLTVHKSSTILCFETVVRMLTEEQGHFNIRGSRPWFRWTCDGQWAPYPPFAITPWAR